MITHVGKQRFRLAIALFLTMALLSCAGCRVNRKTSRELMPTPLGLAVGLPHPGGDFSSSCACSSEPIPVFVVSGRNVLPNANGPNPFGNERSPQPSLGVAYVTIGDGLQSEKLLEETTTSCNHKQSRVKFDRIELSPPLKNFEPWRVKDDVVRYSNHPWVQQVANQLNQSKIRNVTIFVHGYNTEFVDNTLLAAEIFHYLGRQGAMLSFEWPSESRVLGYVADKANANYSTRQFRALISNIAKECEVDSITIIAHSAGSPIVVNALREIRLLEYGMPPEQIQNKYRIGRVVLAAPDMDSMGFVNAIHDGFHDVATGVAVYASPQDRALRASEKLSGVTPLGRSVEFMNEHERDVFKRVPKIEMINVAHMSKVGKSFLGHSYFHRDPWVSSDIGSFILGRSPTERGLIMKDSDLFWAFPRDYPERLRRWAQTIRAQPKNTGQGHDSMFTKNLGPSHSHDDTSGMPPIFENTGSTSERAVTITLRDQ